MNKFILFFSFTLLFLLSGCSQKNVEIDPKVNLAQYSPNNSKPKEYEVLEKLDNPTYNNTVANESRLNNVMADNSKNTQFGTATNVGIASIYFEYDQFSLSEEMVGTIKTNSTQILKLKNKVRIEGNCDEWGSDEYNFALGLKRAKSVKESLVVNGVDENKIVMLSLGESNPVCNEKNEGCWKQNRRVDFVEIN